MKARFRIQNQTHFAEWPETPAGKMQAKAFRKNRPEFKRRKIRAIIQACPDKIPCGEVIELNEVQL